MQSICEEATYLTIAHDYENGADLIKKIDAIIEKYRPTFIPEKAPGITGYGSSSFQPVIRWVFETYSNFNEMLSTAPYGGSTVTYPGYERDSNAQVHASQTYTPDVAMFVPACGMECPAYPENYSYTGNCMSGTGFPANRIFILTISCNYPFSSSMVRWLFNRGSNTRFVTFYRNSPRTATGKPGTIYLLWARGAGIVNAK